MNGKLVFLLFVFHFCVCEQIKRNHRWKIWEIGTSCYRCFGVNEDLFCWQNSWTPLLVATKGGHSDVVHSLLHHDLNVNATDKVSGCQFLAFPTLCLEMIMFQKVKIVACKMIQCHHFNLFFHHTFYSATHLIFFPGEISLNSYLCLRFSTAGCVLLIWVFNSLYQE